MSTPKFLRNPKTGARFRYSAHLAKRNPKLVPCSGSNDEPAFEQVNVDVGSTHKPVTASPTIAGVGTGDGKAPELDANAGGDGQTGLQLGGDSDGSSNGSGDELMVGEVPLAEATKDQLADFAQTAFGEKLDKRKGEDVLREQVAELLKGQG